MKNTLTPLTIPDLTSGGSHYLTPLDYATIYNVNPVYPAITGAGVTIAVVGRTNINIQDVISFRSLFGLPANPPNIIVNGPNPGDLGDGEEAEAVLDTSWAGALATGATIDLVVSASTNTTDGVNLSELYIINNNLGERDDGEFRRLRDGDRRGAGSAHFVQCQTGGGAGDHVYGFDGRRGIGRL